MRHYFLPIVLGLLLLISACSENDNPTSVTITGYSLDQFIRQADVIAITDYDADPEEDFRDLYAYQIIAEDGWSPRNSSNAGYDLPWNVYRSGYLVPDDQNRVWFEDTEIPGAFRVKNAREIRLYRHVEVTNSSRTESRHIQLGALPIEVVENWNQACEEAVRLSDIILGWEAYESVTLIAADGYSRSYSPEQIAEGFYLLDSEITTFPSLNDGMTGGEKRFRKIASITINGGTPTDVEAWGNANELRADLTVILPESFDSYEGTELTNF